MSKHFSTPIPAWLRRRGYSPRTKVWLAAACERTRRRSEAPEPESRCEIIPFPVRPLALAREALQQAGPARSAATWP
ncbi:hypothetical protein [Methylobacterium platani]|uniref:Uncharacterized protein n=2 Tax=Methylobacterium platani TaxID=427683 RepID=A0A179SC64_9HYPH|nr:hypothetical protein [Methylobacterium platani]KMO13652.1 hypothetical protein SQ03_21290 [Methylobacterium platani JCM 14648]OAS25398.1 hypothetical protein A5481_10895 [Methylobacterium platani]